MYIYILYLDYIHLLDLAFSSFFIFFALVKNCSSTGEVNWCPGAKATEAESTQPVTNQHVLPCASGSWWRVRSNLREAQSKSFMMLHDVSWIKLFKE